jgi:Trk-type K+ transport system membrane component
MFIGGGSISTAGGIKVTTLALLVLMVVAEARGQPSVAAFRRRVTEPVQRQAVAVTVILSAAAVAAAIAIMVLSAFDLSEALFESISALTTTGLSLGGTGTLPDSALAVLIPLMYLGRVGPVTLAVALALSSGRRRYEYPHERPLVG